MSYQFLQHHFLFCVFFHLCHIIHLSRLFHTCILTTKDLLSDDYTSKVTLKCKKLAGDKTVTIETERASSGALSSKVGTKFSIGGFAVDKIQLKPKGDYALETSTSPMSGLKLTFKGGSGADVGVEYTTGSVFATGVLDAKDMSKISTSLCMGVGYGANVGGSLAYSTGKSAGISSYSVGGNYSSGPLFASLTTSKGQANLGLLYSVNSGLSLASTSVHSADSPLGDFTVGCAYKASIGDVKAKIGSDGVVSACVSKDVAPKVSVTVSGSVAGTDFSTFKYGLGVTM